MIGESEIAAGIVKLRDVVTREELEVSSAMEHLKIMFNFI